MRRRSVIAARSKRSDESGSGSRAGAGGLALALLMVVVSVLVALLPGAAGASGASPGRAGRAHLARGSQMRLSQAPAGLRAAVRRTLALRAGGAASVFQQGKLSASDAASGDQFGDSVAVSGSTAVIGAPGKNSGKGAAYVFVRSGATWSQQQKLTASDATGGDRFGVSVAIYGQTVVVGAPGKNSSELGAGAAYVFVRSGTTWSQQQELTASDAALDDGFGFSVAVYGQTAVVGAYPKNSGTGAAYVFVQSGSTWSQQQELTASDGASGDQFGYSVALYGQTAVVGAYAKNTFTGAAYVFVRSGTTWSQQQELTASDASDQFGDSVAISGSTAIIGADGNNSFTGAAYVFTRSGTTWSQQAELTASDGAAFDQFGVSVAISGQTAIVGANDNNSSTGAAYVFVRSGTSWPLQAKLTASDSAAGDDFGFSVAISGSTAVAGADAKNSNTGAAYAFALPYQQAELTASDGAVDNYFGVSVAIYGSTAVVGAPGKNSNTGAAYVFVRSGSVWSKQQELTASDAAAGDFFGISVAIYGSTTIIGAPDKSSQKGAAYVFVRSGTTWSQQAELTASDAATNDDFGFSVAIYGSTAVAGAYNKNSGTGAAYVFVGSGGVWSQQAKLLAADRAKNDGFGWSVAVYGSTAVVGARDKNSNTGAAYVFLRSGSVWSQQAKLTASDHAANDDFGNAVAIYGSTAVVGAYGKNAAYVFVRSGTTWSQQAKLTASDPANDLFGFSVSLYGSTAMIADGAGNSYVFVRSGAGWSQQAKLTVSSVPAAEVGQLVAVYGSTVVVGAPETNSNTGAAYVFANL